MSACQAMSLRAWWRPMDERRNGNVLTTRTSLPVTFVLVPGAGGQAWYWHRVVEELEMRGHAAVAVDLPAADDTAGLDDYADTIADAAVGRDGVVLVAQSMGRCRRRW